MDAASHLKPEQKLILMRKLYLVELLRFVSSILLFFSGVIIAFDRLTYGDYSSSKAILLLIKVLLTFVVLFLTWNNRNAVKENKINPSIFISMIIYLIATILSVY